MFWNILCFVMRVLVRVSLHVEKDANGAFKRVVVYINKREVLVLYSYKHARHQLLLTDGGVPLNRFCKRAILQRLAKIPELPEETEYQVVWEGARYYIIGVLTKEVFGPFTQKEEGRRQIQRAMVRGDVPYCHGQQMDRAVWDAFSNREVA